MKKFLSILVCICLLFQAVGTLGVLAEENVCSAATTTPGIIVETDGNTVSGITPDEPEPQQCGDDVWFTLQNGLLNMTGTGPMWNWAGFEESPWYVDADKILYITISEGITEIGCNAFMDCTEVTEVVIPESVTRIGSAAFLGCEGLTSMHIPTAVTSIEHDAFTACLGIKSFSVAAENTAFKAREGCLYTSDGKTLRNYPLASPATTFSIPDGTTTIGSFAFAYSKNLSHINFNDELVFIDDYAFTWVENLTRVDLPDSLKRTGGQIFGGCTKLADINLPTTMERIGGKMLLETAYYNDWSNWIDGVLYLDNYLLETVYLPSDGSYTVVTKSGTLNVREGTTLIAEEAADMSDITAVNFNNELLHIGFSAFSWLDLETVILPDNLLTLGDWAFYNCTDLENIYIGPNLQYIGHDPLGKTAFDIKENYENGILYYDKYLLKFNDDLPKDVVVKEGITLIAESAFYVEDGSLLTTDYGAGMSTITFPDSLTTICDGAFYSCLNLKKINIPSTVTTIGEKAVGWKKWYDRDREEEAYALLTDFTIQCEEGSAAEAFAIANGIRYERPPIQATDIIITSSGKTSLFMYIDDIGTYILSAQFQPEGCVTEDINWSSNNESVATVDKRGHLTARGVGEAVITANTKSSLSSSLTVTVVDIPTIAADEETVIDFNAEADYRKRFFTPTEDGFYTFSLGDSSVRMKLHNQGSGRLVSDNYGYCEGELFAGNTYLITMHPAYYTGVVDLPLTITMREDTAGGEVVSPSIVGLEVVCTPNKMEYYLNEPFDNTGMVVELVYSDGSRQPFTNYYIDGYDSDTPGVKTLRVYSGDFSDTFDVFVENTPFIDPENTTKLVIASAPNKVTYTQGEALNTAGMVVKICWADGSESRVTGWTVSGYDPNYIGTQTLTVSWEGLTATFMIDVYASVQKPSIIGIALINPPKKCVYTEGEQLSVTGGKILVYYDNNQTTAINITNEMVSGYDSSKVGYQTLTIKYENAVTLYMIEVIHDYKNATCSKAATCKICGDTDGKPLGHSYKAATCTAPKTCKVCKATSGKALGHNYEAVIKKATLTKNGSVSEVCSRCDKMASKTTIKAIKSVKLSATSYTYDGKVKKPSIVVKDTAGKTVSSKYYTVTYASGRKNVGVYKVTVKFKGNYSGTKTLTFTINPSKTTVKSLTAAKKSFKVSITKKSTQVTGYEVQYSTSKKFTSAKTKTIKSYKSTSLTVKSLSAKKTYYVRVRTYKTVNGKKYYSGWSTAKSVKTK